MACWVDVSFVLYSERTATTQWAHRYPHRTLLHPPFFCPPTLSVEHLIGDGIHVVVKTETPDQNVIKTREYREQQDIWRSKPRQDQDLIYIKEKLQRTMTHTCFDSFAST